MQLDSGVGERDPRVPGHGAADVASSPGRGCSRLDDLHGGVPASQVAHQLDRSVARAAIDDDHFVGTPALGVDRGKQRRDGLRLIVYRDHQADSPHPARTVGVPPVRARVPHRSSGRSSRVLRSTRYSSSSVSGCTAWAGTPAIR